jgi:hypothetical protein
MNISHNKFLESFEALQFGTQQIVRQCARAHLMNNCGYDVGSSDVYAELYRMWINSDSNWSQVIINEVDAMV